MPPHDNEDEGIVLRDQSKNSALMGSAGLREMVQVAAQAFELTERAKAEIVQAQLIQFSEVLKIKLRSRLYRYRFEARRLWAEIEADGGGFYVPETVQTINWDNDVAGGKPSTVVATTSPSSAFGLNAGLGQSFSQLGGTFAMLFPNSLSGRAALVLTSVISLGSLYRRVISDLRPVAILLSCASAARQAAIKLKAMELSRCLNVFLAFEENGEDELESERVLREISERIAVRHVNHVSKLSKNGQKTLANVVADRIFRHISRHRNGYAEESLVQHYSNAQQFFWSIQGYIQSLIKPADRRYQRPPLDLYSRCVRALAAEAADTDHRLLELEPYHENTGVRWTASEVLSRSAVLLQDEGVLYVHPRSQVDQFSFVWGLRDEIKWRRLKPASAHHHAALGLQTMPKDAKRNVRVKVRPKL